MYVLKCSRAFISHPFMCLRFPPQIANFKMCHYYFTTYYVGLCVGIEKGFCKKMYLALRKFIKCVGICTECQITKKQKSKV